MADNPCTGCGQSWRDERRQEPYKPRPPKTAYIAGPYRAGTGWAIEQNIQAARQVAATLWGMGIAAFCPHANTAHMDGAAPEPVFLAGLLEILRRGNWDMLILLPGWEGSEGTQSELAMAWSYDLPVYHWPQDRDKINAD